jgi:hypothetical protein
MVQALGRFWWVVSVGVYSCARHCAVTPSLQNFLVYRLDVH